MSSRDKILAAITASKPALTASPAISMQDVTRYEDVIGKFRATLEGIGGKVMDLASIEELQQEIETDRKQGHFVLNAIDDSTAEKLTINESQTAIVLERVHKAFIMASIGVAENGSVWIKESQMINRLLPFICQHLVIVLERSKIVSTMHHAYQQINTFEEGFGVFLAGPSKTADIEQSLVIGAHGARSVVVYLID